MGNVKLVVDPQTAKAVNAFIKIVQHRKISGSSNEKTTPQPSPKKKPWPVYMFYPGG